jgi:hypothetical protein
MLDGLWAEGNNACMLCYWDKIAKTDFAVGQSGYCGNPTSGRGEMTVRNISRPIARVFRATAAPGCRNELLEKFHSSSATLVNSKVGALNIEFSSRWTRPRLKLCSSPSGGTSMRSKPRLATRGSNHTCQRVIPHL